MVREPVASAKGLNHGTSFNEGKLKTFGLYSHLRGHNARLVKRSGFTLRVLLSVTTRDSTCHLLLLFLSFHLETRVYTPSLWTANSKTTRGKKNPDENPNGSVDGSRVGDISFSPPHVDHFTSHGHVTFPAFFSHRAHILRFPSGVATLREKT